jgi:hypothetical protein
MAAARLFRIRNAGAFQSPAKERPGDPETPDGRIASIFGRADSCEEGGAWIIARVPFHPVGAGRAGWLSLQVKAPAVLPHGPGDDYFPHLTSSIVAG